MADWYPRIASSLMSVPMDLDTFANSARHKQSNSLSRLLAVISREAKPSDRDIGS